MHTISFTISRLFLFILAIGSLSSCLKDDSAQKRADEEAQIKSYVSAHNITVTPSASGLYTIVETLGSGATPLAGNDVLINYELRTLSGTLVGSNDTTLSIAAGITPISTIGGPYKTRVGTSASGFNEAIASMKEGGTSSFIIPSILWQNNYVPYIMKITLVKVLPTPKEYELTQIYTFLDTSSANKLLAKPLTISDSTSTGIYYIEKKTGTGLVAAIGKTVSVKYVGRLIDGRKFDHGTQTFVVGGGRMIAGFEKAVQQMRLGGTASVVIPYSKAYGGNNIPNTGSVVVPYYSTLIFDMELVSMQ